MKRAIILHCWSGYPEYCWYQSVRKELESLGFEVQVPAMPDTDEPKLNLWLPKLQELIGAPDEDLYLIGHSIGSVTILRYLESLPEDKKIGGAVLVAGFIDNLGFDELKNFFETPLDYAKIKSGAERVTLMHSDNDPYVPLSHGETLKEKLGAELIVKSGMKHFSGDEDGEESCTELPDVTEAIKKIIQLNSEHSD